MSYTVCIYNGNVGSDTTFDTFEGAKAFADDQWHHLTPREREKTTDAEGRTWFYISENDEQDVEVRVAYDYADEMGSYVVRWTTTGGERRFKDFDEAREFYHSVCSHGDTDEAWLEDEPSEELIDYYNREE